MKAKKVFITTIFVIFCITHIYSVSWVIWNIELFDSPGEFTFLAFLFGLIPAIRNRLYYRENRERIKRQRIERAIRLEAS
jgi:hypothetical protein